AKAAVETAVDVPDHGDALSPDREETIEGVTPKRTGNGHGRRKQNKTNKQGRKQTEGSGRESSLQRTS
ncbi:unnamed protein product, partial [Ascophyllum nodosum]